ncbi:scavenger receptor class F, member 2 [Ruegeria hyattellae]|uniref:scavenger receptor class F, member 2 n=1 Tax=Ruegeria hyattellae TaxID=3233337 RepID=UPI00355BBDA5
MTRLVALFWLALLTGWSLPALAQGFGECRAGQLQCGTSNCCGAGESCSFDGHCIPLGGNYCGGGRSCPVGQLCMSGGLRCAPHGSTQCADGTVCTPGTVCAGAGRCKPKPGTQDIQRPVDRSDPGGCLPGRCPRAGWFLCEETESQCRPGFKCSSGRGCVPLKAVDCGYGRWCKPGQHCGNDGACLETAD